MPVYTITAAHGASGAVLGDFVPDFFAADARAEILQNCKMILATMRGSVPLDRGFGIDAGFIDMPMGGISGAARARAALAVLEAIAAYEPRVQVLEVDFLAGAPDDGGLLGEAVTHNAENAYISVEVRILDEQSA